MTTIAICAVQLQPIAGVEIHFGLHLKAGHVGSAFSTVATRAKLVVELSKAN